VRIFPILWEALRADDRLSPRDIFVYQMAWQECPGTMVDLAELTRLSKGSITQSCASQQRHGWLTLAQAGATRQPVALLPHGTQELLARLLRQYCTMVAYKGEFLMRSYLNWRITSEAYIDNARPAKFINPSTGERLESDRLYLDGVGFEYNGPQHYQQTKLFSSTKALQERRTLDLIKLGLSLETRIPIVVVTADQLHPTALDTLIPDTLPRRPIDTSGPYFLAFVQLCAEYVEEARSWTAKSRSW
jgi:hypothetical protein